MCTSAEARQRRYSIPRPIETRSSEPYLAKSAFIYNGGPVASPVMLQPAGDTRLSIDYVNYTGERAWRSVTPIRVWFGTTDYHPEARWLLEAFDNERGDTRNFAVANIISWRNPNGPGGDVVRGVYRHFKGKLYQVIDVVRHSEDDGVLVLYRPLYGEFNLWVRPVEVFTESIVSDGRSIPRFELLAPI